MVISCNFEGGNIIVERIVDCDVYLQIDQRSSQMDWFYWCFKVCGAEGKTVSFHFPKQVIGYFGPAISYDNQDYYFQRDTIGLDYMNFSYTFGPNEKEVYFAHDIPYRVKRFDEFVDRMGITKQVLCMSEKGREVPYVQLGHGKRTILLTSRHHCCESTGTFVLEGVLEQLLKSKLLADYSIYAIPFVDYDGVVDGDQGKGRSPYDHGRDYVEDSIYSSIKAIEEIMTSNELIYAFDFHSPWHFSSINDKAFIVQTSKEELDELNRFGLFLEKQVKKDRLNGEHPFMYEHQNDFPPDTDWNHSNTPKCAVYALKQKSCRLAFTLETAYFGEQNNMFSKEAGVDLGKSFARTLEEYIACEK